MLVLVIKDLGPLISVPLLEHNALCVHVSADPVYIIPWELGLGELTKMLILCLLLLL